MFVVIEDIDTSNQVTRDLLAIIRKFVEPLEDSSNFLGTQMEPIVIKFVLEKGNIQQLKIEYQIDSSLTQHTIIMPKNIQSGVMSEQKSRKDKTFEKVRIDLGEVINDMFYSLRFKYECPLQKLENRYSQYKKMAL